MSFEFELTITMRIDADETGASVCACEITGEKIPVDLIMHLDEVIQTDLDEGDLNDLPTNRLFNAQNSFELDEGDPSVGLASAWVSVYDWELLECLGKEIKEIE